MARKALGIIVVVLSLGLAGTALVALLDAPRMAPLLAQLSKAHGQPLDPADWLRHWRLGSVRYLGYGLAGLAAGVGILRHNRWGFLLWAVVVSCALFDEVVALAAGHPIYAFEASSVAELAALAVVAVGSWVAYGRVVHRAENDA
jgi:hypothetical protein